jgi:CTP synthase (UTP-ammonia lyase)
VAGIPEAAFEETSPDSPALVITRLACSLRGLEQEVLITPGTLAFEAYGKARSTEKFLCSFGLNEEYRERIFACGLRVSGQDAEGHVRIAEGTSHPFFMGTLFVPQLSSTAASPHPLLVAFVRAAFERSNRPAGETTAP